MRWLAIWCSARLLHARAAIARAGRVRPAFVPRNPDRAADSPELTRIGARVMERVREFESSEICTDPSYSGRQPAGSGFLVATQPLDDGPLPRS